MPMVWDNSNNDLKNADFNFMTKSPLMLKKNLMLQRKRENWVEREREREREWWQNERVREISDVISDHKGNSHTIIKWDYNGEPSLFIHQGFGYIDLMWTSSLSN